MLTLWGFCAVYLDLISHSYFFKIGSHLLSLHIFFFLNNPLRTIFASYSLLYFRVWGHLVVCSPPVRSCSLKETFGDMRGGYSSLPGGYSALGADVVFSVNHVLGDPITKYGCGLWQLYNIPRKGDSVPRVVLFCVCEQTLFICFCSGHSPCNQEAR